MNIENNNKVLDLIFTSIISEGGDGDALWLSKYTELKDITILIENYNKEHNTGWEIQIEENRILWGINQEWAIITDDENLFNSQPSWITLRINY